MRHWLAVAILTAALMTVAPVAFHAQEQKCEIPPAQVFAMLDQLGEKPFLVGPGPNGSTGIVARNPDTQSWTFVLMAPNGCVAFKVGGDKSSSFDFKPGKPS